MCRIVFWNVHRKNLTEQVCELAQTTQADIVILNECQGMPIAETLQALQQRIDERFFVPNAIRSDRFHCFIRDSALNLSEVHTGFRTSFRKLVFGVKPILLAMVHGADIRNHDSDSRQSLAQELAREVQFVQSQQGINRVILMGDFNMNPYDSGMNLALGLNAMMTRACVASGQRQYQNLQRDFYYNPMWSLFGDNTEGPAGTIYNTSGVGPYGWSMLDQVIFHYSTVDHFESVRILDHTGNTSLVKANGRPDSDNASDHLPILVKLKGDIP